LDRLSDQLKKTNEIVHDQSTEISEASHTCLEHQSRSKRKFEEMDQVVDELQEQVNELQSQCNHLEENCKELTQELEKLSVKRKRDWMTSAAVGSFLYQFLYR
jgi:methyl-accepting chemotaxis protein